MMLVTNLPTVLICDDDSLIHMAMKQALKGKFQCKSAFNGEEALVILRSTKIDVILLDIQMRTDTEGLDYLPKLKEADPDVAIIMNSGLSDFATVRAAMKLGAFDYVPKDFSPDDLEHTILQALERKAIQTKSNQTQFEVSLNQKRHQMVGKSKSIESLRPLIEKFRKSQSNVLIHGETGSGKEVIARLLRKQLPGGDLEPFIPVDSSTIQDSTAESILFGHEKGAFTGADKLVKGVFEEANGGVVYFDEIANMPIGIQTKLLRVLQEKEISRLGSSKVIPLEFRVIAASNQNLEEMCKKGLFKDDLYQRLAVLPISVPPLRERKEDVPLLVKHFCRIHAPARPNIQFAEQALQALSQYPWPGNIRELSNTIAFVLTMADQDEIDLSDLPPKFRGAPQYEKKLTSLEGSFYDQIARVERDLLSDAYRGLEGNISRMALTLGMDRSHLYSKLKEHGIHPPAHKAK